MTGIKLCSKLLAFCSSDCCGKILQKERSLSLVGTLFVKEELQSKNFSGIRTWIIGVESEHTDHKISTMAQAVVIILPASSEASVNQMIQLGISNVPKVCSSKN